MKSLRSFIRTTSAISRRSTLNQHQNATFSIRYSAQAQQIKLDLAAPHRPSSNTNGTAPHVEGSRLWYQMIAAAIAASALYLGTKRQAIHAASKITTDIPSGLPPANVDQNANRPPKGRTRRSKYNFIADVVENVEAAVVHIYIEGGNLSVGLNIGQPSGRTGTCGSGFIIHEDGLILTNAHVVVKRPESKIKVRLWNGDVYNAYVEHADQYSDLATLRLVHNKKSNWKLGKLPTIQLGESSSVRPGEFVLALGCPLSLSNTVTTGVVSQTQRTRQELGVGSHVVPRRYSSLPDCPSNEDDDYKLPDYIQTDATITFGNSGGPLINLDGEAIGINAMQVTPGISFAIPIDYVKGFLARCRRKSIDKQPPMDRYVGISMLTITPDIIDSVREQLQLDPSVAWGVVVFTVVRGSPVDVAGIMPGDVIVQINKKEIRNSHDIFTCLNDVKHKKFDMTIVRKSQRLHFTVQPAEVVSN